MSEINPNFAADVRDWVLATSVSVNEVTELMYRWSKMDGVSQHDTDSSAD